MSPEQIQDDVYPEQIKEEWKQVPAGDVILSVESVERVNQSAARNGAQTEIATEQVKFVVVEPGNYEGIEHKHIFWLGSDTDPLALQPETLSHGGASKLKAFAAFAGVAIEGQNKALVRSELKDRRVGAHVYWKVTPEGFIRANVTSWFAVGEKVAQADEDAMKAAREQAQVVQASGGTPRGGALPPRLAHRGGAPLPPARPVGPLPVRPVIGR